MKDETLESNKIVSELSEDGRRKMEAIQYLAEPCDRQTYGERLREAAERLDCSIRTVQRLVNRWEKDGLLAFTSSARADKGQHRTDETWKEFIIKTYKDGNKNSKRITPAQVALKVKARAHKLGLDTFPSHMTVYRILKPVIESQKKSKSTRSIGWKDAKLSLKTKDGQSLAVEHSNQVWQCDHTLADILLVDQYGQQIGRPRLTIVIDSYSRCIVGINLGFDAPSSQVMALALRHAILPKDYSADYKLNCKWETKGKPEYLFTDRGKDFQSDHAQQIATQLGFVWHYRDRPSEGGIVERPFGTLNTNFFSTLPGYTGSNVQKRPEDAEKNACLTLLELERLLVRYIVDNYNQTIDARMGNQTRFQRWEAGLIDTPNVLSERALDICLMKQTRRTIYRGGYVQFENLTYRGENLSSYKGESVILRYDPRDITTVFVYHLEGSSDVFLDRAFSQNLGSERVSLDEVKANIRKLRKEGKAISNRSILEEVSDRHEFEDRKRNLKQIKKDEQALISTQPADVRSETVEETVSESPLVREPPQIYDYDQLRNDYGLQTTTQAKAITEQVGQIEQESSSLQKEIERLRRKNIVELEQVKLLHNWLENKRQSRQLCRIVGESRTGKTVACDAYRLIMHKQKKETGKLPTVPVLYIESPLKCGSQDFFGTITKYFEYKIPTGDPVKKKRETAHRLLKRCKAEMLIIDEADRLMPDTFAEVYNLFKELGISVVLVGTGRLDELIKRNDQLYRSFEDNDFENCFRFETLTEEQLRKTVETWELDILCLPAASNLTSEAMLSILRKATRRCIGLLDMVLRKAAILSLEKGLKKIDKATLQEAIKGA